MDHKSDQAQQIADIIDGNSVFSSPDGHNSSDGPTNVRRKEQPSQRDRLIRIADHCELWHDANGFPYATFCAGAHRENWRIRSPRFRRWLSGEYFCATSTAAGRSALDDALELLEARAINDGPNQTPFIRVGRLADKLYLDLVDDRWRAIEISGDGWSIVRDPPVRFLRTPAMRPLPEPEPRGKLEELRQFINVRSDADFTLTISWLVAALRDCGPYPILVANGEQGSGKSDFCRMLRLLIDPNAAPIRASPREERDLLISAGNCWMLAFDNLSSIPTWLSDAMCRLATGGGYATRALHTDRDEIIFEGMRPILLNGIPMLTDRADLADRTLTVHLKMIEEKQRRTDAELFSDFEKKRPHILGGLLDAVSAALHNLASVQLPYLPRLADFAKWVTAAESSLGWSPHSFLRAYESNRRDVSEAAFEADCVAVAIYGFVKATDFPDGWRGSATALLAELSAQAPDNVLKSRGWPRGPSALGSAVSRAAPLLRTKGFKIERYHSGGREIEIIPPSAEVS